VGVQTVKQINGVKVLKTGTGGVFINGKRTNIITHGGRYFTRELIYENISHKNKVRKGRKIIEREISKLRGLSISEALIKLGLIC